MASGTMVARATSTAAMYSPEDAPMPPAVGIWCRCSALLVDEPQNGEHFSADEGSNENRHRLSTTAGACSDINAAELLKGAIELSDPGCACFMCHPYNGKPSKEDEH